LSGARGVTTYGASVTNRKDAPAMTRPAAFAGLALAAALALPARAEEPNVPEFKPAFPEQARAPAASDGWSLRATRFAGPLEHPWGLAELPSGDILVTERPGRLRVIDADGTLRAEPVAGLPEVWAEGQGGLLDVAIGPDFAADRMVYWTYSKPVRGGAVTAAARGRLSEDLSRLTDVTDIWLQNRANDQARHFGSRIVFALDGALFVTTGDRGQEDLVQRMDVAYGKVVRIAPDGSIPADNPFADRGGPAAEVWTLGHRNVQGAAIDPETGALWTIEHGPRGGDELNLARPGLNFGWPVVSYGEEYGGDPVGRGVTAAEGMAQPVYYWDPVIAPGGMLFHDGAGVPAWRGDVFVGAMRGGVARLELADGKVVGEERLEENIGRVRDVAPAPGGGLYALIDEPDGAIMRLDPVPAD
jgi:glucose/arabinose dehydrogenase